ncbi:MAG: hypothetical protein DMG81_20960 [Acidobacteria bacterium]|nr:MAG: hypothetical protein DMG81_20960 [Acidobacteriota bacterium]
MFRRNAEIPVNQPIMSSDKVSTGVSSRAEVQLDHSNILRLGDNTLTTVASLSRTQIQVQVARGLVDYTVFKGSEADVEINTANVAIHPAQKDGIYRVEVNSEGETQVIVRKGEAEISTPQGSTHLEKGRMVIVRGTAEQARYKEDEAPSKDSWDSWNNDRDRAIRDAQSWSHTNRYYVGSEDLDAYGRWDNVPDYGPVWVPAVSVGWAPYRSGRWVWEPGWGWTWVSDEPWGWAPYHHGRWFMYTSSWLWWPGPVYGYPRYRPAGCRSDRVTASTRGTGAMARASTRLTWSTSRTSISTTGPAVASGASPRFAPETVIPTCVGPPWTRESVRGSRLFQ